MVSERLTAGIRAAAMAVAGATAAIAWGGGLYATATLAGLVASWIAALAIVSAVPVAVPAPPPAATPNADQMRRLTAYLDLSPAPLVALDDQGRLHVVNRAARRLLGAADLVPDAPPILTGALGETAPGRTTTVALVDGDSTRSFALATGDLALGGSVTRIGALIDIDSELKAAEATALRELVQVLSHEIVNALTPIASLAQTAAEMLGDPAPALPQIREAIDTVARRASSLHRFGETYRALARLPAPTLQRIAVAAFVADLARLFATRWPAIALTVDAAQAPASVQGDPDQLTAAIWAVLQNAAEALAETVSPEVMLALHAAIGATTIDVVDNGPGITVQDADAVFRPFFTTKAQGTGVGLALARQILRGHGGDLTLLADEPGRTRFRAILPGS